MTYISMLEKPPKQGKKVLQYIVPSGSDNFQAVERHFVRLILEVSGFLLSNQERWERWYSKR